MANVLSNGIEIPSQWLPVVGRTFGIVQGQNNPDETPAEALARLDDAMFHALKRMVMQTYKRELVDAQAAQDDIMTKA